MSAPATQDLRIVAVGMLDWEATGADIFFVQINADEVMLYEAHRDGRVVAVVDEPAPLVYVTASIEKFNNTYRVQEAVALGRLADLPSYLGRFEITSDTACRYLGPKA